MFTRSIGTHRMVVGRVRKASHGDADPVVHYDALTYRIARQAA